MSALKWYRNTAFVLAVFLAVQLTGLTCLQDDQASSTVSPDPLVELAFDDARATNPDPSSQAVDQHDCPCHSLVTHLSGFVLESTSATGELIVLFTDPLHDAPPSAVFHPPLFFS